MDEIQTDPLIRDFGRGEADALRKLLRLYRREISYFTWGILKDRETADEIVNDCFLKAWQARETFASRAQLRSYLYVVSRNDCLNFLKSPRSRKLENIEEMGHILHSDEDMETRMMHSELLSAVYEKVERLPEKQRRVFQMAFFEGRTTEEIAAELNISTNAVFLNKSQALKFIRKAFGSSMNLGYLLFLLCPLTADEFQQAFPA